MKGRMSSVLTLKQLSWDKCSRLMREQRTRLYIMWRCTVILLCWDE
ncbi:hypothetical protein PRUPE_1G150500 [Prunus persica]|uniref:Uncharacterized protein n=1 Tax=Prunus persica TaxID=3760 RepID=A0A251QXP2_PRUPE|nr:hypothetical protein PRUPE_1G150500 [Prunus persica]